MSQPDSPSSEHDAQTPEQAPEHVGSAGAGPAPLRYYSSRHLAYTYAGMSLVLTALSGACWSQSGFFSAVGALIFGLMATGLAVHFALCWPFTKPGQRQPWIEVNDSGVLLFGILAPWEEIKDITLEPREPSIPPMHFLKVTFTDEVARSSISDSVRLDVLRCEGITPEALRRQVVSRMSECDRASLSSPTSQNAIRARQARRQRLARAGDHHDKP